MPVSALLIEAALLGLAFVGLRREQLPVLVGLYTAAFAGLLWAYARHRDRLGTPALILGWALVFRLTLLFGPLPDLSDDYVRYTWDGYVSAQGISPYAHVPADPALESLAETFPTERINSRDYYSVYPPVSQLVFVVAGWCYPLLHLAGSFLVMRIIFVALEFAGVCLMAGALRRGTAPLAPLVLYAWNPLVIAEVAGQGHSEACFVFGMGLAIYALYANRQTASWSGLVIAGLSKLLPFVFAPLWLRRFRQPGALAASAVLGVLLIAPFWTPELIAHFTRSLDLYVRSFEFNAGLYLFIKEIGYLLTGEDKSKTIGPALRTVFLGAAVLVILFHPVKRNRDLLRGCALLLAAYLITATTVHPWYLIWPLLLVPFTGPLRWSWVWLSFACFLSYFEYTSLQGSAFSAWTLRVTWLGFYGIAAVEISPAAIDGLMRVRGWRKARQLAPFVAGDSLLDLGCAEGYVGSRLARGGRRCHLADVVDLNRSSLPFTLYDGTRLPFEDDRFDTVVLSLVLHHCEDAPAVISEAARVARRRVLVTESTYETEAQLGLLTFLDRLANRVRSAGRMRALEDHLQFRTVPQWGEIFARAGLEVVETRWLNRLIHKHVLFVLEPGSEGR
jgi:SAM-dependent methyltransferase